MLLLHLDSTAARRLAEGFLDIRFRQSHDKPEDHKIKQNDEKHQSEERHPPRRGGDECPPNWGASVHPLKWTLCRATSFKGEILD
jgi:hypothetical protein